MYRLKISDGAIFYTESVRFVRKLKSGSPMVCPKEQAQGVLFQSVVYNLPGQSAFPDAPTVLVNSFDMGQEYLKNKNETQNALAQTDETAIELFEQMLTQEEINKAQDDTLIEIFEMIGG